MMPLSFAKTGDVYRIARIGGNAEMKHHLGDLGFVEGDTIEIVSEIGGNFIVNIKDTRVAVSKELASKISVIAA